MNIRKYIQQQVRRTLREAEERDPFVSVRPNQGSYDVTNANDLRSMFFDPSRKINNGEFVTIVYVEDAKLNKTFKNKGYVDRNGNEVSADEVEKQGRAFGKDYLNNFYDSDEYQKKRSKAQGGKRPFGVFRTVTQQINWAAMNYPKRKDDEEEVFRTASDSDLNDFTANDADFKARLERFKELHNDMKDELEYYETTNSFPREIVNQIRKTHLANRGKGWSPVDGNDYVSRHEGTGNEALRLTKNDVLNTEYQSYVIFEDKTIKRISKEEYFHLVNAFGNGATSKKTNPKAVQTSIRSALEAIRKRYDFRNYLIPQIAKMSFTIDGKPVTYKNHELNVGGVVIDADDFLNSPMTESRKRRVRITEKALRNLIRESIADALEGDNVGGVEKFEYYYLPTDSFGQPSGEIREIELTPEEFEKRKRRGDYIYDDYAVAARRAYD